MLMQMMSNGGIGGGVASSIERAMGAGKVADAEPLTLNALVLAVVFGVIFAGVEWLFGAAVYRCSAVRPAPSRGAEYGHVIFSGAVFVWIVSLLAAAFARGQIRWRRRGHPDGCVRAASALAGPDFAGGLFPAWRAGAGIAVVVYVSHWLDRVDRILALRARLVRCRSTCASSSGGCSRYPSRRRIVAIGTIQSNLTVVLVTGAVGLSAPTPIAGYGIASRLDYIPIPLLFALGQRRAHHGRREYRRRQVSGRSASPGLPRCSQPPSPNCSDLP